MVGPLLLGAEPKPLPADLEAVAAAAGEAGIAYLSFGTTFRPSNCGLVRALAGALAALAPMHAVWAIDASRFPGELFNSVHIALSSRSVARLGTAGLPRTRSERARRRAAPAVPGRVEARTHAPRSTPPGPLQPSAR